MHFLKPFFFVFCVFHHMCFPYLHALTPKPLLYFVFCVCPSVFVFFAYFAVFFFTSQTFVVVFFRRRQLRRAAQLRVHVQNGRAEQAIHCVHKLGPTLLCTTAVVCRHQLKTRKSQFVQKPKIVQKPK